MTLETAVSTVLGRTEAALLSQTEWSLGEEPVYSAEIIEQLMALTEEATPAPWKAVTHDRMNENWPLLWDAGNADDEGGYTPWGISTDRIHASELVSGNARTDARFVAAARNYMKYLIRLVQAQRLEILRLGRED